MGNLLCCVPCRKKRKPAKTTAFRWTCARTPVDTRKTKYDDRLLAMTGAMTGFDRVVRRGQTVRIFVDCYAYPVRVERCVLPDLSAGQLEASCWAMLLLYTSDLSRTLVIAAVQEADSQRTLPGVSAATIEDCPDRAAPVGLSQDEERAQLEKAAHLKAKRKANFKKLKAKQKAKKLAIKTASGDSVSPTEDDRSMCRKSDTDNTNAMAELPTAENCSRLLHTDNRLEWFMDMDAPDLPVDFTV